MLRCGFCAREFAEDHGQPACQCCPLGSGCGRVRCPWCGYENPVTPAWMQSLRAVFGRLTRPGPGAGEGPR